MDLFVMQVLKMAMHVTVEMLMISLSQLTLKSVTFHALALLVNSVAARGVCKYMILKSSKMKMLTSPNIQKLQLKHQRLNLNLKQLRHQKPMPF